jgi:hypothetical protein
MTVLAQMRQYPLLNFTIAKSACAGTVAVRLSASAPTAKKSFFIARSPCVTPFSRRLLASRRGPKDFDDGTGESVAAQIVGLANVTGRRNQPLQIWRLKKPRSKPALMWPRRLINVFSLHNYRLQPRSRGAFSCSASIWMRERLVNDQGARRKGREHFPSRRVAQCRSIKTAIARIFNAGNRLHLCLACCSLCTRSGWKNWGVM